MEKLRKTLSTKIAILVLIAALLISSSIVVAQPGVPTGVCGFVNIDGIPADGFSVSITHLASGKTKTYVVSGGGYACCFEASDGDIIRIDCVYNEVTYYNTTVVDLSLFEQWLNLSINTGAPPPECTICAYVADADTSVAISGATVTCDGESEDTDADGMAYFTVFPNIYTVIATKTGYQSDSTTVTVGFNDVFTTLYLTKIDNDPSDDPPADPPDDPPADPPPDDPPEDEPGTVFHNLTVTVFDNITEMPINNVSVIIYDPELNEVCRNNTNESGVITFQLEEGDYVIVAEKDGNTIKRGAVNLLSSMGYEMLMNEEGLDGSGDFTTQQGIQGQDSSIVYVGICISAIIVVAVLLIRWKGWVWKSKKAR